MNQPVVEAEVISIMHKSQVMHPDTKEVIHIYTVGYVTEDGRAGESILYLNDKENEMPVLGKLFKI